ncbi:MAG: carbamoyltransferase [Cyanobacteria bacterium LVE1205-1]|jgi:carbamoyltransferase
MNSSLNSSKVILGISCYYHDSAACLLIDGDIKSAVQEERFSRIKHDARFPVNAIKYCLNSQGLTISDVDLVIYYEKPFLTFERLLETYLGCAPRGIRSFLAAMQVWIKEKLFLKTQLKKELRNLSNDEFLASDNKIPELLFSEHHLSHAAAAFYPSPYTQSVILCMDGVGEWATTSAWMGDGNTIQPLWEINFPHSLGLLYSAFTYYCGFKVNSGEYKLMGLAPYGTPKYADIIKNNIVDIKPDGSFRLNLSYFKYHRGFRMTSRKFDKLFGQSPRKSESNLTQFHMDLASSIQLVTEEIVLKLAKTLKEETGADNLCLAGGVALNCVANGKLLQSGIFKEIWIQPAAGDAGSSIGAGLVAWHQYLGESRTVHPEDSMKGTYLGPKFENQEICRWLDEIKAPYLTMDDSQLMLKIAELLDTGNVIGWFNGAMEFGPRALGNRSIIGDPRNESMQSTMNLKIKYRESFRPFAPSILEEELSNQFEMTGKSPYMLFVAPVKKELCREMSSEQETLFGIDKLNIPRSEIPAVTHVDYSARIQTVSYSKNPRFHQLISTFHQRTGCPLVVNTSFNVRGEPIVCTPQDAYQCFMRTGMDVLVVENQLLYKNEQPEIKYDGKWLNDFELD